MICAKVLFMRRMVDSLVIRTITVTFSDYALYYGHTKRNVQIEEDDRSHPNSFKISNKYVIFDINVWVKTKKNSLGYDKIQRRLHLQNDLDTKFYIVTI